MFETSEIKIVVCLEIHLSVHRVGVGSRRAKSEKSLTSVVDTFIIGPGTSPICVLP